MSHVGTAHRKLPWGVEWSRLDGAPGLDGEIGIVLPEQTASPLTGVLMGEMRLYAALLADAVRCLRYPPDSRDYQDAAAYFFGASDGELLPFLHVCHTLGINPHWLRTRLRSKLAGSA